MNNPAGTINWLFFSRVLIGGYFVVSGISKLARPYEEFLFVVQSYALLPPMAEDWLARLLPWAEALGGAFLAAGLWTRQALALVWALCTVFILALVSVFYRRLHLDDCGCIAIGVDLSPKATLAIDIVMWLILAAAWKGRRRVSRLGVDDFLERRQARGGSAR